MYLKYKSIDIDTYYKNLEIAMFQGIAYDYYCGCCRISFVGTYVDILKKMSESEYRDIIATFTNAIRERTPYLELKGTWILDFEENTEDWDDKFSKAINILE